MANLLNDLPPCPLCGSPEIKLLFSHGGVGGQMITVAGFAKCEECLTVFQGAASSTAGFSLREAAQRWRELPEDFRFRRESRARHAALARPVPQESNPQNDKGGTG